MRAESFRAVICLKGTALRSFATADRLCLIAAIINVCARQERPVCRGAAAHHDGL